MAVFRYTKTLVLLITFLFVGVLAAGCTAFPSLICSDLIENRGYPCEDVVVTTDDGWLLGVQHIPHGKSGHLLQAPVGDTLRPPVLLQHGLIQSADTWLLNEEKEALALVLAERGYDVWLGNTRGSRFSHGHSVYKPSEKRYWDWSFDELAQYDLPAMLTYIHAVTGQQVFYVAHSQMTKKTHQQLCQCLETWKEWHPSNIVLFLGTMIALAAFERKDVAKFVAAAALMSPIVHLNHVRSQFIKVAATVYLDKVWKALGLGEFSINSVFAQELVGTVCTDHGVDCGDLLAAITGPNCCINMTRASYDLKWTPDSTSVKNMAHFAQMVRSGKFCRYDYGWTGNLRHYGRLSPPPYLLSNLPPFLPFYLIYGDQDALGDPEDFREMVPELPSVPRVACIRGYAHVDFVLSVSATEDVYNGIHEFFQQNYHPTAHHASP